MSGTLGHSLPLFMGAIIITLLAMDMFRTPVIALMPDLTPPSHRSPANGIINLMGGVGGVLALLSGIATSELREPLELRQLVAGICHAFTV